MSGFNYANLVTDIRNYTEVGDSVLTAAIINRFIEDAEFKIFYDVPIDAYRYVSEGTLVTDDNTINVPGKGTQGATGAVFVRGIEVFNATSATTGQGVWLEKKDQTYLSEYVGRLTGTEGDLTNQDTTGLPKYYAMFGGATGTTSTTSGGMYIAPTPDQNYKFRI